MIFFFCFNYTVALRATPLKKRLREAPAEHGAGFVSLSQMRCCWDLLRCGQYPTQSSQMCLHGQKLSMSPCFGKELLLMLGCSSSEAEMDPSHEKISVAAKHYHQARTGPLEIIWVFSVSSETRCEQGLLLRGTAWETEKIGIFVL